MKTVLTGILLLNLSVIQKNALAQFDYFSGVTKGVTGNAVGFGTTATGQYSTATGYQTSATGLTATAIGNTATASGTRAVAIGYLTSSPGWAATSIGQGNIAGGTSSVAMGYYSETSGQYSIAIGSWNTAAGIHSKALGTLAQANGESSFSIGVRTKTDAYGAVALGRYNSGGGSPNAWVAADPLFEIGNGTAENARANAMTIFKDGKVNLSYLKGTGTRMVTADVLGNLSTQAIPTGGDNLGNHIAAQNINLNGKWLSGNGLNNGISIAANGFVGIGTTAPQSMLAVKGKVTAQEIEITMNGWADFVFNDDYVLKPLDEVEKFIRENKHLPGVPAEAEVLKNGIRLGEMNAKLLQKIEELTLYVIELKKVNDASAKRIKALEAGSR